MIKAIIFGATGMVGEGVLLVALRDPRVESVLVIGRRSCNVKHPKLRELVHKDFFDYTTIEEHLRGWNACFFCLGVTSVGKREPEYTRLTYDLTMAAARTLARLNPDMTFCYVSGTGTDSTEKGRTMWARVKGRTENDLRALSFRAAVAFRPGFIKPIEGQQHAYGVSKVLGLAYPLWKILFPAWVCTLEDLGLSMIQAAAAGSPKPVLENPDIAALARKKSRLCHPYGWPQSRRGPQSDSRRKSFLCVLCDEEFKALTTEDTEGYTERVKEKRSVLCALCAFRGKKTFVGAVDATVCSVN